MTAEKMREILKLGNGSDSELEMLVEERFRPGESRVRLGFVNGAKFWERSLGMELMIDEDRVDAWSIWARERAYYQLGLSKWEYLLGRVFPEDKEGRFFVRLGFGDNGVCSSGVYQEFDLVVKDRVTRFEIAMEENGWRSLFDLPLTAEVEV